MQDRILYFSKKGNFFLLKFFQKLLLQSLSCKLKTINKVLRKKNDYFVSQSNISLEDMITLMVNLRNFSIINGIDSFYLLKKKGFSIFFQTTTFYISCVQCLWNFSVLPILETNSDKYSYGFRPFRSVQDLFVEVKNSFLKKKLFLWNVNLKINSSIKFCNNSWLLKNFPMQKKILKSWLEPNILSSFPCIDNSNIFFSLINFSINGLVRDVHYWFYYCYF